MSNKIFRSRWAIFPWLLFIVILVAYSAIMTLSFHNKNIGSFAQSLVPRLSWDEGGVFTGGNTIFIVGWFLFCRYFLFWKRKDMVLLHQSRKRAEKYSPRIIQRPENGSASLVKLVSPLTQILPVDVAPRVVECSSTLKKNGMLINFSVSCFFRVSVPARDPGEIMQIRAGELTFDEINGNLGIAVRQFFVDESGKLIEGLESVSQKFVRCDLPRNGIDQSLLNHLTPVGSDNHVKIIRLAVNQLYVTIQ
jgi:hypothetical protein